jgi:hypothetical protein
VEKALVMKEATKVVEVYEMGTYEDLVKDPHPVITLLLIMLHRFSQRSK